MQNRKSLSLQIAGAVTLAMLFGTSAFAETRHRGETARSSSGRIQRGESRSSSGATVQRDRSFTPSQRSIQRSQERSAERSAPQRSFESRSSNETRRFESRDIQRDVTRNESRSESRNNWRGDNNRRDNNNQRYESRNNNRNDSRNYGDHRGNNNDRFRSVQGWRPGSRAPYYNREHVRSYGRVDRYVRERNGYRVWIGGGLFPIFVPFAHWNRHPLRVGLYIRFGGYWDPLGYWSVYDYSPYDYRYGYDAGYSHYTRGEIRGVVESVDLRRGTMVINDDLSHQFVTVELPRDRRAEYARPGDYIELSGDWTRSGVFIAYRVDRLDEGRY